MLFVVAAGIAGAIFYGLSLLDSGVSKSGGRGMSEFQGLSLPDIAVADQGGDYKRTYDLYFVKAANLYNIPWALMKAHAIQESSINPSAYLDESGGRADRPGWASRGLMQLLWSPTDKKLYDRFKNYGYPGKSLGTGTVLFDPEVNTMIAAQLIRDNLRNFGSLRDAVNAYNTGKSEAAFKAPHNYVDRVIGYYETITKS